ncbi:Rid family hydrolase [Microbacteriaceae bacterium K1510]|nr:Rid family hydrolase [Microbacteriaceae bacterium K1510]
MACQEIIKVAGSRNWEAEFGFHPAVKIGNMIYLTGHVGCDAQGICVSDALAPQVEKLFENLQSTLHAAGSDLSRILQMTCFIVDILRNGPLFWEMRKLIMPHSAFTSASIGIHELADPRLLIEIQGVAYCD